MSVPPHSVVLVVDDHRGVRDAMALLDTLRPDLVLVNLHHDDGRLRLVADLNSQGIPLVVCSSHQDPEYARRALDAGARTYVAKGDAARSLPRILKDVLEGWVLISPRAAE